MTDRPFPEVIPVTDADYRRVIAVADAPESRTTPVAAEQGRSPWLRRAGVFAGGCWRIAVGAYFCFNYFTSILVVGWIYRWMQARVLLGWWKQSPLRQNMSFEEVCAALGPDAPARRPRWFWQESIRIQMGGPAPNGSAPGKWRVLLRAIRVPWTSLWLNAKIGLQGLFCTYLVAGWGCFLMLFSWEFGWLNSFHKGYEQALIGPLSGITGILLFIVGMIYVPMAQVHQAATGNCWAFFDFKFVWNLIRARLTAYAGLAAVIALASLPLEILKTVPAFFEQINPALRNASNSEFLSFLNKYLISCTFVLFPALLLTHGLAAVVYRSAVLKVFRRGWVKRGGIHPRLVHWLDFLQIRPEEVSGARGLGKAVRFGGRSIYRVLLYTGLILIWFLFIAKVYVGEFLNYHPIAGLANHPLIQIPCFDYVPSGLKQAKD